MANMRAKNATSPVKSDRDISQAHHSDSITYNFAHAERHLQEAEKHFAKLKPGAKNLPSTKAEMVKLAAAKAKIAKMAKMKGGKA